MEIKVVAGKDLIKVGDRVVVKVETGGKLIFLLLFVTLSKSCNFACDGLCHVSLSVFLLAIYSTSLLSSAI